MPRLKILIILIFICSLCVFFLPLFTFTYLYPSMDNLLVRNSEEQSIKIANHFVEYFEVPDEALTQDHVSYDLKDEIFEMLENFSLEKVKVYSSTGEVLFSTEPKDIGQVNNSDYFNVIVMRGQSFTNLVKKDAQTLEGRLVEKDVIETYIPIRGKETIVGAFEIYVDLTDTKSLYNTLVYQTSIAIFSVAILLLVALVVSIYFLAKNMEARDKAEKQLNEHREELELLVKQRTAEVTATNVQLQDDIAKRIKAENALQISESKFRSMVEMAGDAIILADADTGIISDINNKGTELLGRSAEDLIGLHLSSLHPSDNEELYSRLIDSNYTLQVPMNTTLYVEHISGKKIPVDIRASTIERDKGRIVQGIFRDISQRMQFEEELQKTEKLKTASVLAGGIAHDFNNLLTAVLGNISLAKLEAKGDDKVKARLVETEKAIARAKDLTHQLLTFAKGSSPIKKVVELSGIIIDSAQFVLRGSTVKSEFFIPEDLWPAEVDEGQLNQVINNLVINAAHAMKDGGICSVVAENVQLDKASGLTLPSGKYVKISIKDQGHGIARETLGRIFDPFFTTKPHGSGLGLSSSYSIIKNHGGEMTVESEVGKGSVFSLYIPASAKQKPEKRIIADEENLEGDGKILVMDDEDVVREAVTSLLQYLGYEVDTAKDGREAIGMYELSQKIGHVYDAVIMDLTVPGGMGGKEAVAKVKEMDPAAKVIVSSGYYTDPVMANFQDYGFDGVVPKPYQVEELGSVLKDVLSSSA